MFLIFLLAILIIFIRQNMAGNDYKLQ